MHKRSVIHFALATTLAALLLSGCGPKKVTFDVVLSDFKFEPTAFEVPPEAEVTLNLTNNASVIHEFVVMKFGQEVSVPFDDNDEGNIFWEAEVEPGTAGTFMFVAPAEKGEYQLVCGTPGHFEAGMVGTFTVK
jgi:uncharacterized cupredoxin-like copper-binding protein